MLTSFFRKSTFLNFLVIIGLALLSFAAFNFMGAIQTLTAFVALKKVGVFVIFVLLLFFSNFILIKDKSAGRHTFVPFLLLLFCIASPSVFLDNQVVFAGFFCVLGFRRATGLMTGVNISKKIFDAFFCFAIAGLFYPSAIIFLVIPVCAMFYFVPTTYKNWLIPLVALVTVFVLQTVFSLATTDRFFNPISHFSLPTFQSERFLQPGFWLPVGTAILFGLWAMISFFVQRSLLTPNQLRAKYLLVISFLTALAVVGFSPHPTYMPSQGQLVLFIPIALIGAKYLENKKARRLKEILLLSLGLISLSLAIILKWDLI